MLFIEEEKRPLKPYLLSPLSFVSVVCSDGFHYFSQGNTCLGIFSPKETFWNAFDECETLGAKLATIESGSENSFVGGKSGIDSRHFFALF